MKLNLLPYFLLLLSAIYSIWSGSVHRADARLIEALRNENRVLVQRGDEQRQRAEAAAVDARRLEGLQADLAGTRAYLAGIQAEANSARGALQVCRRELREARIRTEKGRQAELLMPSGQGG